jgi:hypothetical protein
MITNANEAPSVLDVNDPAVASMLEIAAKRGLIEKRYDAASGRFFWFAIAPLMVSDDGQIIKT